VGWAELRICVEAAVHVVMRHLIYMEVYRLGHALLFCFFLLMYPSTTQDRRPFRPSLRRPARVARRSS